MQVFLPLPDSPNIKFVLSLLQKVMHFPQGKVFPQIFKFPGTNDSRQGS
jgi:hypothetical protein